MTDKYQVTRDGKVLFTSDKTGDKGHNECFEWLLNHQSASVSHAIAYEGYQIKEIK